MHRNLNFCWLCTLTKIYFFQEEIIHKCHSTDARKILVQQSSITLNSRSVLISHCMLVCRLMSLLTLLCSEAHFHQNKSWYFSYFIYCLHQRKKSYDFLEFLRVKIFVRHGFPSIKFAENETQFYFSIWESVFSLSIEISEIFKFMICC